MKIKSMTLTHKVVSDCMGMSLGMLDEYAIGIIYVVLVDNVDKMHNSDIQQYIAALYANNMM